MQEPKENKKLEPKENKTLTSTPSLLQGEGSKMVRIKMRPLRAAEGVVVDENGYATVDAKTAEWLVSIQYADLAEEK